MATLVIHAPQATAGTDGKWSFDNTFESGIAKGYAIAHSFWLRSHTGCKVVLLSKDERKRAEGRVVRLEPTEKANNGIQRYNVHMEDLKRVPYKPEALNRQGVALI